MSTSSPSRTDPVVRVTSAVIGGPAGRRLAGSTGFWRALPVLVLMAVAVLGLGVVQKQHCRAAGWTTPDQFWHACYSDIPVIYGSSALGAATGRPSLLDAVGAGGLGQPPLLGAAMWVVSATVDPAPASTAPRRFFDVSVLFLAALLIVAVVAVALAAGRRRRWDAAHVAVAPVLLTSALISYDLLAVAFLATALLAWSRRHPAAAGFLLGGAIVSRPVTAMVAVALLGVCARAGRLRQWGVCALAALVVWVAVRLVLFTSPWPALSATWQAWKGSTPGYGSLWLVPSLLLQSKPVSARVWYSGPAFSASATTAGALLGLLLVGAATVLLAASARHRPRVAHLALFALASSLLVIKSLPVQACLLLLPLVALAGLKWRDHLIWATTELAYFVGVWLYIAAGTTANRGLPAGFYLVLLLARCAGIGWLAVQAVRAAVDPLRDPVRVPVDPGDGGRPGDADTDDDPGDGGRPGNPDDTDDDPLGGVVDQRPDVLVVRLT